MIGALAKQSHIVAVLVGIALALVKGVLAEGAARHFDTRYFFAAGECLLAGQSPYNLAAFQGCWEDSLGLPFRSSFVFLPTSLPYSVILGAFSWEHAKLLADGFNLFSLCLLAAALVRLVKPGLNSNRSMMLSAGWLLLGLSSSGVLGAIFVGQGSVLVAASLAWLFVAVRDARQVPFGLGTLFATVKPQLSIVALSFGWFSKPNQLHALKLGLVAGGVASVGLAFAKFPQLFMDYRASLQHHVGSRFTGLAMDERLYGLPDLLRTNDQVEFYALLVPAVWLIVSWGILRRWKPARARLDGPEAIAFVVLFGAFLFPIKDYDFAVFAIVFAMVGTMPFRFQLLLGLPLMFVWRPALASNALALLELKTGSPVVVDAMILATLVTLGARLLWPLLPGQSAAEHASELGERSRRESNR